MSDKFVQLCKTTIINLSEDDKDKINNLYFNAEEDCNPSYGYNDDIVDIVKSNELDSHEFTIPDIIKIVDDLNAMEFCCQISSEGEELLVLFKDKLDEIFNEASDFEDKLEISDNIKKEITQYLIDYDKENPDIFGIKPTELTTLFEKDNLTMNEARTLTTEMYRWSFMLNKKIDIEDYMDLYEDIGIIHSNYESTFESLFEQGLNYEDNHDNLKLGPTPSF